MPTPRHVNFNLLCCNKLHYTDFALNLNNRSQTDVILLDFNKTFNKVSHHLLLLKLEHYGIRGRVLSWITDFLSDHSQCIVCGGYSSEPVSVVSGVPQGSVIGPLLFLYILMI